MASKAASAVSFFGEEAVRQFPKRANRGLWGRTNVSSGYRDTFSKKKTRRTWKPNVQRRDFYSPILNEFIRLNITTNMMRTMAKRGGFDEFFLRTPPRELTGYMSVALQQRIIAARERKVAEGLVPELEEQATEWPKPFPRKLIRPPRKGYHNWAEDVLEDFEELQESQTVDLGMASFDAMRQKEIDAALFVQRDSQGYRMNDRFTLPAEAALRRAVHLTADMRSDEDHAAEEEAEAKKAAEAKVAEAAAAAAAPETQASRETAAILAARQGTAVRIQDVIVRQKKKRRERNTQKKK